MIGSPSPGLVGLTLMALAAAGLVAALLTRLSLPLLQRYALARPNARSSHQIPTPQGAGIAVIIATLLASYVASIWLHVTVPWLVTAATVFIALVGFVDDLRPLPVVARLLMQAAAVGAVVLSAPMEFRIVAACPLVLERALLVLAGVWFVNLVNFMDGLDLMTASETVPITVAIVLVGWLTDVPLPVTLIAAGLCGAMLGFVPFNRPVARVFLGDVGSLPIGLLLGWLLLHLAWHHYLAAALLLPAYYLADATLTLLRRVARHEPFWIAHRSHFYQRATDHGFAVIRVVSEVFVLNVVLAALALAAALTDSIAVAATALIGGTMAVGALLWRFSRPRHQMR